MAIVGYARVSTTGQKLEVQLDKLRKANCEKIYQEKKSGGNTAGRPQFQECMRYLREGDTLVISKLDRLARSVAHLARISEKFQKDGIELVVLDQNIDTRTPTGRLLFNMLGAIAEFETDLRKERQKEGILKAKEIGIKFGRKPALSKKQIEMLVSDKRNGASTSELRLKYKISPATIYRHWAAANPKPGESEEPHVPSTQS